MLISEKGLVTAMSTAAKKGGYRIRFDTYFNEIWILTDDWIVRVEWNQPPRKVLGLIAEHFGYLPEDGCFKVTKAGSDDFEIQTYLYDTFNQDAALLVSGEWEGAICTGILVWDMELYVSKGGQLRGTKPALFGLLDDYPQPKMVEGKCLMFVGNDGSVFLRANGGGELSEAQLVLWKSLESFDWWKIKEAEEGAAEAGGPEGEAAEQLDFDELGDPPADDEPVDPPAFDEPVDPPSADEPVDELVADEDFSQEADDGD